MKQYLSNVTLTALNHTPEEFTLAKVTIAGTGNGSSVTITGKINVNDSKSNARPDYDGGSDYE